MIEGGCQCGAVRYALKAEPKGGYFCHCRMCQRAVGGPFAAMIGVCSDEIVWTRGTPTLFQSSSLAIRGFCNACGTPLSFTYNETNRFQVTIGSLDHPENYPIEQHYSTETRLPWLKLCDGLPEEETCEDGVDTLAGMVSYQSSEGS